MNAVWHERAGCFAALSKTDAVCFGQSSACCLRIFLPCLVKPPVTWVKSCDCRPPHLSHEAHASILTPLLFTWLSSSWCLNWKVAAQWCLECSNWWSNEIETSSCNCRPLPFFWHLDDLHFAAVVTRFVCFLLLFFSPPFSVWLHLLPFRLYPASKPQQAPELCAICKRSMLAIGTEFGTSVWPKLSQSSLEPLQQVRRLAMCNSRNHLFYFLSHQFQSKIVLQVQFLHFDLYDLTPFCPVVHFPLCFHTRFRFPKLRFHACFGKTVHDDITCFVHRPLSPALEYRDWEMSAKVRWPCRIR